MLPDQMPRGLVCDGAPFGLQPVPCHRDDWRPFGQALTVPGLRASEVSRCGRGGSGVWLKGDDLLPNAVLEDLEVGRGEIGDRAAPLVTHDDIDDHA